MMEERKPKEESLLEQVKNTSDDQLARGVEKVDHLSLGEDEEDGRRRGLRAQNRATVARVRRWFYWFVFGLVCIVLFVCVLGFGIIVYLWVQGFIGDPQQLEGFVFDVVFTLLVVLATLFIEGVIRKGDD